MSAENVNTRRQFLDSALAPVMTAVILGVVLITLVSYVHTKKSMDRSVEEQISQALGFLNREINLQLNDMLVQVNVVSQEEVLRLALEDSYLGRSAKEAAQRKLVSYVRNGMFERLYLLDAAGVLRVSSSPELAGRLDVSDRRYFLEARGGNATLDTVPVSRVTGRPILVASVPLRAPNGSIIGVVAGIVHTEAFARGMLNELKVGSSGGAYIATSRGELLASPAWAAEDTFLTLSHAKNFAAEGGEEAIHRFEAEGMQRFCLSRRNKESGWILVLEADEDEVLAPARRLAGLNAAISFITLALVAVALGALRRVMANLRNSEADHRALTELSPVGIITLDPQLRPQYMNRKAREILGLGAETPPPMELPLEDSGGEPLKGDRSPLALALADREPIMGRLTWTTLPGGQRKALYLNATPLAGENREAHGLVATLEDITERMEALKLLNESEERFASLFRLSPDSIVLSDLETGAIVDVNETFLDKHGFEREEVIGKTVLDLGLYTDDRERERIYERARTEGHVQMEAHGRDKYGDEIILSLSSQVMEIGEKRYRMTVARDVTHRHRAEQELRENRRLLETILNTVPLSIFWKDVNCVFLGCNRSLAQAMGLDDPKDIVGKTDFDFSMPREDALTYRADDQIVMQSQQPKLGIIEPLVLPSGKRIWLETSKLPMLDEAGQTVGLLGIFQDITERLQTVERIKQSEERFSRLFRLSPEAILLIDLSTRKIVDANEAFCRLTGHALADVIGHNTLELGLYVDPSVREQIYAEHLNSGLVENIEFEARRKDGQTFLCSTAGQSLEIGSRPHLLVLMRDVTELKKMQEMMIQTEKMISVGGIAAGIAHEINNPLGIVLQAAQNLVQRTRGDFQKNLDVAARLGLDMTLLQSYMRERKLDVFIQDIQSAAVRASSIIRHMLDFSRSSESRRKVCDLPAIADRAVTLAGSDYDLKKSYDFKRIKVVRDYADDLPSINCTETELEQVLLNLLRNAAQALASVQPPLETPTIRLSISATGEDLRIEVADNGPGMPPEVQRRVFEPFFTTKPPGVGTGLGLSVSYFIITKGHGGRMSVSSQPGAGTSFLLELPLDDKPKA